MRNTRLIYLFFLLAAIIAAPSSTLAATPVPAAGAEQPPQPTEQYVLNMATIYSREHPAIQDVLKPWAESLLEQSGGRLVIRIYDPETITSSVTMSKAVKLGQIGLGCGVMGTEAELFPLGVLVAQGPGTLAIRELSGAYWRMFNELPELNAEFVGIKLLAVYATSPYQICMVQGLPYDSIGLMGKRFLVDNPMTGMKMAALEAIPTVTSQTDFKMLLEDGIADGVVLSLTDMSRIDIESYIQSLALGDLENGVVWFGMHQGDWDMLPPELRRLITQSSGLPLSQALGASVAKAYRNQLDALRNSTMKVHYFSAEERDKFQQNMQNVVRSAWQKVAQERGINARNLEERINRIMSEARVR